jgi:hypothetical protein
LSPLEVGDSGYVIFRCHNATLADDSIDFVNMTLGKSVLDDTSERPRVLSLDEITLIFALFGTGNCRIMEIFLEQDGRIVVDMSSFNRESALGPRLVTVVESKLSRVLFAKARVTTVEGEVGKILRHVEGLQVHVAKQ